MYIWIGCELPKEFELDIRDACLEASDGLRLDFSGFTLPQHISLKISFQAGEMYMPVLDYIEKLLRREKRFSVIPKEPERTGSILWLDFRENGTLRRLHNILDRDLLRQYGVPQHLFDKAFAFHSTLAVGDPGEITALYKRLEGLKLPESLEIRAFLLGISESGKSGTYRVVRRIEL
jgi:2'-5' RNA ligase